MGVFRDGPFFPVPPIMSGMPKATKFKFGMYIQSVNANKSPLRIWEKRERWRMQGLSKFLQFSLARPIISKRVKLQTSKLASIFRGPM